MAPETYTGYSLRAPANDEEWRTYHAIRRKALFESRGLFGVYSETHPDEFAQGHYPMILIHGGEPIGVLRIDVDGELAIFRRVAVRSLAEDFARGKGSKLLKSYVNPEAVGFYERCGFDHDLSAAGDEKHVPMYKKLW